MPCWKRLSLDNHTLCWKIERQKVLLLCAVAENFWYRYHITSLARDTIQEQSGVSLQCQINCSPRPAVRRCWWSWVPIAHFQCSLPRHQTRCSSQPETTITYQTPTRSQLDFKLVFSPAALDDTGHLYLFQDPTPALLGKTLKCQTMRSSTTWTMRNSGTLVSLFGFFQIQELGASLYQEKK